MSPSKPYYSRKTVGSYPSVNVIFSITTALFMIGLFAMLAFMSDNLTNKLKQDIEVQVFLNRNLLETEQYAVQVFLSEREYLDRDQEGKPRIRYQSKDEAAAEMIKEMGEDFVKFLGENPLRNAYIIHIREDFYTDEKMEIIKKDIESIPNVYEVAYTKNYINEINSNLQKIGLVIGGFVSLLLVTVVILINNAIKLALFSQRFLIRSMQLVGATDFFIKRPFLVRASLHGLLSAVLGFGILLAVLFFAMTQLNEVREVLVWKQVAIVFVLMAVMGTLIGYMSSYSAVSRYLDKKLDELY